MSGNQLVFSCLRKISSNGADVTSNGKVFHSWGPTTGNARPPTVERCIGGWTRWRRSRRL